MFFRTKIAFISICCILGMIGVPSPSAALSLNAYLHNDAGHGINRLLNVSAQVGAEPNYSFSGSAAPSSRSNLQNTHKIFGYGTVLFAGMAGFSGGDNSLHKGAGIVTAVMAVGACATGWAEYGDYFNPDDGLSAYNLHIILGTAAAAGFAAAAVSAESSGGTGHAGLGIASTAAAVVPIFLIKF